MEPGVAQALILGPLLYLLLRIIFYDLFDNPLLVILLDKLFVNNTPFFIVVKNHTQPGYDLNTDLT